MRDFPTAAVSLLISICVLGGAGGVQARSDPGNRGEIVPITTLPQQFTGTTVGGTRFVSSLGSPACASAPDMPGPEVVYTWVAAAPTGVHIDFIMTPASGFDAAVYVLAELDNGNSCIFVADNFPAGMGESIHLQEILVPGHRYYLYVDSSVSAQHSGEFNLLAYEFIGVGLQSFEID